MSEQHRRRRRRSHGSTATFSPGRLAFAAAVGAVLVTSAYQFAFAGGSANPIALLKGYGVGASSTPAANGSSNSGLPLAPLIAVPAAAGTGYAVSAGSGNGGAAASANVAAQAVGITERFQEQVAPLPASEQNVTEARLVPERDTLDAGTSCRLHLEVKAADGKWYSVTDRPESRIQIAEGAECVVPQEGSRNAFCLPITTSPQFANRTASFVGTYRRADGSELKASAKVSIQLSSDREE